MILASRRAFLRGALAAPAIIAYGHLMPVRWVEALAAPPPRLLTPAQIRDMVLREYAAMEAQGLVVPASDVLKTFLTVERDLHDPNRVNISTKVPPLNQLQGIARILDHPRIIAQLEQCAVAGWG